MPLPGRLLAAVAGLVLVATACTQTVSGNPDTGTRNGASGATFRDCTSQLEQAGLSVPSALRDHVRIDCGRLDVPLDYAHPRAAQLSLALVRVHDTRDTKPAGSLLVNPGGPGVSGLEFALQFLGELPPSVLRTFDLVGFDPRGVGVSSPVRCLTDAQKDRLLAGAPDVTTAAGLRDAEQAARSFAADCNRKVGSGLRYYTTVDTARDMDRIRQAVGDDRMNYLGFSYGTELGWVYAHLFPSRVRTLVLDGAVDPDTTGIAQATEQIYGFEKAFDQFAANCRTTAPCDQLGDARRAAEQVIAAVHTTPLPTSDGRRLTEGLAYTGILQALYSEQLWPRLASGLIAAEHGDGTGLLDLADEYNERSPDGTYTNVLDANTTINCNDAPVGPTEGTVRRTAAQWVSRYPLFGRWAASGLTSCMAWQPHRTVPPEPKAATASKVLVIGNLHDPATPYQGAKDLTADLGNAELLSWDGQGHTSYRQGSSCIDAYVNKYLISQTLPPEDTTCPR